MPISKFKRQIGTHSFLKNGKLHRVEAKSSITHDFMRPSDNILKTLGSFSDPDGGDFIDYVSLGHSAVLLNDRGHLFGLGPNSHGQLGSNAKKYKRLTVQGTADSTQPIYMKPKPIPLPEGEKIKKFQGDGATISILTESGKVLQLGEGVRGELGTGKTTNRSKWTQPNYPASLGNDAVVDDLSFYFSHSVANVGGQYIGWGKNSVQDLGFPDKKNKLLPEFIPLSLHTDDIENIGSIDSVSDGLAILSEDRKNGIVTVQNSGDFNIKSPVPISQLFIRQGSKSEIKQKAVIINGDDGHAYHLPVNNPNIRRSNRSASDNGKIQLNDTDLKDMKMESWASVNSMILSDNNGLPYFMTADKNIMDDDFKIMNGTFGLNIEKTFNVARDIGELLNYSPDVLSKMITHIC